MVKNKVPKIKLNKLVLGYKKSGQVIEVLKDLNFTFYESELIGVVGLNGVGKSTLLKSIAGLLPLLNGNIELDDLDVTNNNAHALVKKVSIVLTEKFGGFNLTAYDVVCAGMSPYTNAFNQLNETQLKIVEDAINACGLQLYKHRLVDELSDGFFQRMVIAKSLAQQTPIMLLDEPSAFLDYASKHELFLLLKKLTEEQEKCILISSHDLDLLLKYCHKLLVVSETGVDLIDVADAITNPAFMSVAKGFI
jgi:iron complex transport system ATP-binding protein